ncbi:MAG TPA: glycoside hydrolase family 6 protein [Candidatus Limnocylindrales bacterium]|nr:glycoside hydrolase family 6 protein [Candidatus Limnocylindrales bacterium]
MRRVTLLLPILLVLLPASAAAADLEPGTIFYSPPPNPGATQQINRLHNKGKHGAANRIEAMVETPQAVWLVGGTPAEVEEYVADTVAAADGEVPVFAVYNVPGRDCAHYSDGGAATGNAYRNWIDGIADGLGDATAVLIIEPDGLALLPSDCGQADPYDRIGLLRYAVDALATDTNAAVYIDAGNGNWHPVATIAERLVEAEVADADGFALNVSNFQWTRNSTQYGSWVSACIAYATAIEPGAFADCPDQYGSEDGHSLSPFGKWSNGATKANLNTAAENERYDELLGATEPSTRFVIDTSRNGRGPWRGTAAHPASDGDTEAWCNPPNRGAGPRPTADTNVPLVDAYLWIKSTGESDGECYRWTNGPRDPQRGIRDPSAGAWFDALARELADNAAPPLP